MTTTTHPLTKEQIADLVSAEIIELPSGAHLRYKLDNDDYASIDDFDCYGKVSWTRPHPYRYGAKDNRPDDFDGTSELLNINGSPVWWQPPLFDKADRQRWHTDDKWRSTMRQTALYILNYGFHTMTLEVTKGTDAYGMPIVVDYTVLGGIEPFPTEAHLSELVYDMVQDLSPEHFVA